jgi:type I restriction enzyme S subunit
LKYRKYRASIILPIPLQEHSGAKNNSQLPKGWEVKKLGEVCEVQRGLTYSGKDAVDYSDIIVLRATNINLERSALDFSELKYLRNNFIIKDKYKLRKGSLLICFSSGSKNHLGKVALVDNNYNYAFGGFIGQINPKREVDSKYLFYSLISEQYKQYISELTDGVNINNLKIKDLQNFQIPTPSLPEQKRIITILDRTFKAIDQAKTNTEQNLKNAKELFESYLNRIFEEKGDDWEEKRLGEVCNIIGGGTPSKKNDEFYIGNIPWATVRDMKTDKIKDTEFKITSKAVLNSSTNIIPKGNVIIATRVGLGKICIIESNIAINQDLKGIIPKASKQLSVGFLFRWFKNISNDIINEGTGATVQGVKLTFVNSLKIPLPKLETQKQIVAQLDQLQTETKKLETIYQQKINNLVELKKSILQKAFEEIIILHIKAINFIFQFFI